MKSYPHVFTQKKIAFFSGLCVVLIIVFFTLGFGSYYISRIGKVLFSSMNHRVASKTSTAPLPDQTNILLLGSDNDQKFTGNPLTQTMMVIHIDWQKKEVDMFSIPRDLWVYMPDGKSLGKIDQAAGKGGIPFAIQVVEQNFGIHVDHYAWVGLLGFIHSINAVGGVNLDAVHPVLDNTYPADINTDNPYDMMRLDIQAGMQHFTGEEVLQYVRSRHEDILGDFGRTQRQRQLLLALKDLFFHSQKSLTQVTDLSESLKDQVKTDMDPVFGLQLAYAYITNSPLFEKQFTLLPPIYSLLVNAKDGESIVLGHAIPSADLVKSIFGEAAGKKTFETLSAIEKSKP